MVTQNSISDAVNLVRNREWNCLRRRNVYKFINHERNHRGQHQYTHWYSYTSSADKMLY